MMILSAREREVLSLACLSNEEIASRLNLTEGTIKFMFAEMRHKLKVKNRTALVIKAIQLGEIQIADMGFYTPLGDYIPDLQLVHLSGESGKND